MTATIKLWDRPTLARSFREYQGKRLQELILHHPEVVVWHVKTHGWQLSEIAKGMMPKGAKKLITHSPKN